MRLHDPQRELRMGIDLGGTTISVAIVGFEGEVRATTQVSTGDHSDPEVILNRIIDVAERTLLKIQIAPSQLRGIGAAVPGEVQDGDRYLRWSPILPTWNDVPVVDFLERRFGVHVAMDNDANAALRAEATLGAGRDCDSLMLLTLGTGIGGAIYVGGRIVSGHCGSAGELGHIVVDDNGPPCECGRRGCLGVLASTTALIRYCAEARSTGSRKIDGHMIAKLFRQKNNAAVLAINRVADYLARGLSNATCVIAPRRIILVGGVVSGIGESLAVMVQERLRSYAYPRACANMEIVCGELGTDVGAVGAALIATN